MRELNIQIVDITRRGDNIDRALVEERGKRDRKVGRRGGSKPEDISLGRVERGTREREVGGEEGGDSDEVIVRGKNKDNIINKNKIGDAEVR